jgi:hypothetical protein
MSTSGPHSAGRAHAMDDAWRRGFAEPDFEDEEPPTRRPARDRAAAPEAGAGAFRGTDDSGAVAVAVDGAGLVADVTVAQNWRDYITPTALGQALLTAAANATQELVAERVKDLDLDAIVVEVPNAPPAIPARADYYSMLDEMVDLLGRAGRDLETYRGEAESVLNATATAAGPNGRVTVTMSAGGIVEVTADSRWASHIRYTEIRSEALGAFRAAARQLGDTDLATVQKPASLVRLQELSDRIARGERA